MTSLRTRLLVIVLLALAPAVVLLYAYAGRQTAMDQRRVRTDLLRVLEADQHSVQDLLDAARGSLVTFGNSSSVSRGDWRAAEASARRVLAAYDDFIDVGVIDPSGRVVVSASPTAALAVSDTVFFDRAVRDKELASGECRAGKAGAGRSIGLAYPLLDASGRVRAVAYLGVDMHALRSRLAPGGLPPDAVESLLDPEGRVMLSVGESGTATAELLERAGVGRLVRQGEEGSAAVTAEDGLRREYVVENILDEPDAGLFLALGFIPASLYADEGGALVWTTAGFALIALVAGGIAWGLSTMWVYWPTRRLATAATRIGRGDLEARARLRLRNDEIGTLGREFDSMADALESRMDELQRTRRELAWANAELEERVRRRTDELEVANRIAGTLQQSLLCMPDALEGVEFGHFYGSATECSRVGGDFYDIFPLSERHVAFLIGDVSGKGLDAASLTALVKNALRAYAVEGDQPEEAMRKANQLIHRFTATETFVTALFGVLDTRTGLVSYATAGHPPPLVLGPQGVFAGPSRGPLLGAFRAVTYEQLRLALLPGTTLVAYTDGVIEARGPNGSFFGEKRFRRLLVRLAGDGPCALAEAVREELRGFGDGQLSDDMALLAVRTDLRAMARADETDAAG